MVSSIRLSGLLRNFLMLTAVAIIVSAAFVACSKSNGEEPDDGGGSGKGKVWVDKKGSKTETFANLDDALWHIVIKGLGDYTIRIGEDQHLTSEHNFFLGKGLNITIKAEKGTVVITRTPDLSEHFVVKAEATLTIDKGITLKGLGIKSGKYDGGIVVANQGKLIMNDGAKLTNFGSTSETCSPVAILQAGTFEMNGGTICDNIYTGVVISYVNGTFIMNGGTISGNGMEDYGYGGVSVECGTFIMNDGTITENKGSGVVVMEGGKFTMKKGRIINNLINYYGSSGGGVCVLWNSTFIMDGGEISGNFATIGGGVDVVGTFTMNGGTIAKNGAEERGGGVFVYHEGIFSMKGGTIAGNSAGDLGGGGVSLYTKAIFTKTGNSIIYGSDGGVNANNAIGGGHAANVDTTPWSITRDFTAGAGVDMKWGDGMKVGWDN